MMHTSSVSLTIIFIVLCTLVVHSYKFDKRSCLDMHPVFETQSESDLKEIKPVGSSRRKQEKDNVDTLEQSLDPSPYNITLNSNKYRRSRQMTATIDGPELNGIFIQVRNFESEGSVEKSLIGTFERSPEIATLDCNSSHSDLYVANTAYSKNTKPKKGLVLKWTAPPKDVGSIQFMATIIHGNKYWSWVKSQSLLFNEFPPDLQGCGKDRSCYRYSEVERNCEDGICDYVVVSQVVNGDVIFTIGGKIQPDTGYVGIGFTADKDKLSFLDMSVCLKTGSQTVEAAHYTIQKIGGKPTRGIKMDDTDTDVDGNFIWCKFRRPLLFPNNNSLDLTKGAFQVFLWGTLDRDSGDPVLPSKDKLIRSTEPWNHTVTVNIRHYAGGGNILKISWPIIFGVLLATLVELYRL